MSDNIPKTKYQILGIPKNIEFQQNTYTFKKELLNSIVSYRCYFRKCKASIKISLENAPKIENKEEGFSEIDFTCIDSHENHPKTDKLTENKTLLKLKRKILNFLKN